MNASTRNRLNPGVVRLIRFGKGLRFRRLGEMIVWSETFNFSASSVWVILRAFLLSAMTSDIS
jgi:hypothetical protein